MSSKCKCFIQKEHMATQRSKDNSVLVPYTYIQGHCIGTKRLEECTCEGDRLRCDFYPGVRIDAERAAREVTLHLPCKVGSKVYRILPEGTDYIIGEGIIVEIRQRTDHELEIIEKRISPGGCCECYPIPVDAFGKTVFCDPIVAEKVLSNIKIE